MEFEYVEKIGALDENQKTYFYQLLARLLTQTIRGVLFTETLNDSERIERVKWLNEILHRITFKIFVNQKNSDAYSEAEIWQMIQQNSEKHPEIAKDIIEAIELSYKYVLENESDKTLSNAAG